ncbi:hypothetical protein E3P96_00517 [Wallemia ichthyophaga]|nr:hypothetical protein E3P96_00517 [Wallemia ichthyophaga]
MIGTILRIEALTLTKFERSTMTIDRSPNSLRKHVLLKGSFHTLQEVKGVVMRQEERVDEEKKSNVFGRRKSIPMVQVKHFDSLDGRSDDVISNARQCHYNDEESEGSVSSDSDEQDSDDDDFGSVNTRFSSSMISIEFKLLIDQYNKSKSKQAQPAQPITRSTFSTLSFKVSRDIQSTTSKLQKLTQLINRKSLFDDKQLEINELTYIIKQDLADLNSQISQLQSTLNQSNQNSQHSQHQSNVVISLQNTLANTSFSFKDVLELRTQNIKKSKQRTEKFSTISNKDTNQDFKQSDSPLYTNNIPSSSTHKRRQRNSDVLALDLDEPNTTNQQSQQMSMIAHNEMLHEYVASNNIQEIQQAPYEQIDLVDDSGLTPLALAVKLSNIQAVDILLSKNANPYSALPHATDGQMAQKLNASIQPPPFYPPPMQQFYHYPPPMDMQMYYPEDQQHSNQIGTLPPPDIARNIPCRFFPGCRYGNECIFMHPQPAMYLPPPPQLPPQFEPIPQPQSHAHHPFYQLPPQMVPPPFAAPPPPMPPNSIPADQSQHPIDDASSPIKSQEESSFHSQQAPPFMQPLIPQDAYMMPLAPRPPPMMVPNPQEFRNNRNITRASSISKRGKDGQLPPCYFFPMGKCRNQDSCAFPHLLADGTDVRDPALRGTAPINSNNSHKRQSSRSNNFDNKKFANGLSQLNFNQQSPSFSGNKIPPSMPKAQAQAVASRTHSPAQRVPTQDDFPSLSSNVSSSSDNGNYSSVKEAPSTAQTTPSSSLVLNNITNNVTKDLPQQSFAAAASSTLAVGA